MMTDAPELGLVEKPFELFPFWSYSVDKFLVLELFLYHLQLDHVLQALGEKGRVDKVLGNAIEPVECLRMVIDMGE